MKMDIHFVFDKHFQLVVMPIDFVHLKLLYEFFLMILEEDQLNDEHFFQDLIANKKEKEMNIKQKERKFFFLLTGGRMISFLNILMNKSNRWLKC
jgi:hypothetical protein